MVKKIYFGDKPLFLTDKITEEIKPYADDAETLKLKTLDAPQLQSLIGSMREASTRAAIILYSVADAFEAVKNQFTLIQASGGLVHSRDKILLIFRRGKWDLPKGKLDDDEDLVNCALREVKEETGLSDLTFEHTLAISYHTYYEAGRHILKETHWHLLKGNDAEVLVPQTNEDIEKCEWVDMDKLIAYMENAPASIIDVLKKGIALLKIKHT